MIALRNTLQARRPRQSNRVAHTLVPARSDAQCPAHSQALIPVVALVAAVGAGGVGLVRWWGEVVEAGELLLGCLDTLELLGAEATGVLIQIVGDMG